MTRATLNTMRPPERRVAFHAARLGLGVALAVLTFILFPASPAIDFPIYEVGSVASDNVIAPFAFRVLKSDGELNDERAAVVRGVEPVFDFVPTALDSAKQALAMFNAAVAQAAAASPPTVVAAVQRATASWGIALSATQAQYLANERQRNMVMAALNRVFDRWLSAGVA